MFLASASVCSAEPIHAGYAWLMGNLEQRQRQLREFGERLSAIREQSGKTQDDVAVIMDKTRNAVSQYENGRNYPGIDSLIAFCTETGVSLDWLIMGREPQGAYERRIHQLPEGLKLYVLEALLLAERVRESLPAKFLAPPTTENYVAFSEYLTKLSKQHAPT